MHTIIAAENEIEDRLQAEDAQEIPANAGHPTGIHILGRHTCLEHALELDSKGKWQFHCAS